MEYRVFRYTRCSDCEKGAKVVANKNEKMLGFLKEISSTHGYSRGGVCMYTRKSSVRLFTENLFEMVGAI
uniref:Uncharacterized protein n=1 Tax=Trichogramma kaykai TaxID=54128 RepID=A0ABD2WD81_9HYME